MGVCRRPLQLIGGALAAPDSLGNLARICFVSFSISSIIDQLRSCTGRFLTGIRQILSNN